ncbi:MAG: hypothetical protein LBR15_03910 [Methanobrevibacter sp.]|jgi:hypothetical protein|nr:hypothetical protein [Candidatus Methanovirga australis]
MYDFDFQIEILLFENTWTSSPDLISSNDKLIKRFYSRYFNSLTDTTPYLIFNTHGLDNKGKLTAIINLKSLNTKTEPSSNLTSSNDFFILEMRYIYLNEGMNYLYNQSCFESDCPTLQLNCVDSSIYKIFINYPEIEEVSEFEFDSLKLIEGNYDYSGRYTNASYNIPCLIKKNSNLLQERDNLLLAMVYYLKNFKNRLKYIKLSLYDNYKKGFLKSSIKPDLSQDDYIKFDLEFEIPVNKNFKPYLGGDIDYGYKLNPIIDFDLPGDGLINMIITDQFSKSKIMLYGLNISKKTNSTNSNSLSANTHIQIDLIQKEVYVDYIKATDRFTYFIYKINLINKFSLEFSQDIKNLQITGELESV